MPKVVAVRKKYGKIEMFKLDDGREISFDECWRFINEGLIDNLQNIIRDDGVCAIRSLPDESKSNNLEALPEF